MKPTKSKLLRGTQLARATLAFVHENPMRWGQTIPPSEGASCGCFIHHVLAIGGAEIHEEFGHCMKMASKLLETSLHNVSRLYMGYNTLSDLNRLCKEIFGIKQLKLKNGKVVVL